MSDQTDSAAMFKRLDENDRAEITEAAYDLKALMKSTLADYERAGVDGSEGARAMRGALNRIAELEANLAEAVDVDLIEQAISDVLSEGGTYRDAAEYLARTILAELERKTDE